MIKKFIPYIFSYSVPFFSIIFVVIILLIGSIPKIDALEEKKEFTVVQCYGMTPIEKLDNGITNFKCYSKDDK